MMDDVICFEVTRILTFVSLLRSFYIGDNVFPLSKGLLEHLFKKIPDEKLIYDQDLKLYKEILLKSNAHRVQNRPSGRQCS